MIECHPIFRAVVDWTKPFAHAARHPRHVGIGIRHHAHHLVQHAHRVVSGLTPPLITVCRNVLGPLAAGGIALLPSASVIPTSGGVGGFPSGMVSEYGAPPFAAPGILSSNGNTPGTFGGTGIGPEYSGSAGAVGGLVTSAAPLTSFSSASQSPLSENHRADYASPLVTPSPGSVPLGPTSTPGLVSDKQDQLPTNTPEPASFAILVAALGSVALTRVFRRR